MLMQNIITVFFFFLVMIDLFWSVGLSSSDVSICPCAFLKKLTKLQTSGEKSLVIHDIGQQTLWLTDTSTLSLQI